EALEEIKYPESWATDTTGAEIVEEEVPEYVKNVIRPILRQEGDKLPVSAFAADGTVPVGTTKYEKRGIAVTIPQWNADECIQCNQCSFVCPHACIRPFLAKEEDLAGAPESIVTKKAIGKEFAGYQYRMQVSPLDCTGCGNCVDICPAKGNPVTMVPLADIVDEEAANFKFAESLPKPDV